MEMHTMGGRLFNAINRLAICNTLQYDDPRIGGVRNGKNIKYFCTCRAGS